MANLNAPSGLSPVKYLHGANWTGQATLYTIASTDNNAFYIGDPVASSGDGDANGIPGVTIGVAGSAIRGVIVAIGTSPQGGALVDPNNLTLTSAPATKTQAYYVLVADDPSIIFEIQESGTAMTSADIGLNANFTLATPPATGVKVSGCVISNSSKQTTSTLNLKLLGLSQRSDNAFGLYAKWLVLINNHELRGGVTGV